MRAKKTLNHSFFAEMKNDVFSLSTPPEHCSGGWGQDSFSGDPSALSDEGAREDGVEAVLTPAGTKYAQRSEREGSACRALYLGDKKLPKSQL